ncbi:DinB family protein [Ferruginibacter sp.]
MNAKDLLILNFEEVRRRSIKVWKSIADDYLFWRPDGDAMNCIEMVRHVLEGENIYHHIILHGGELGNFESPLKSNPYFSIEDELKNAQPYRERFLKMINGFTAKELEEIYIVRKNLGQRRTLGDYLLRIAYHEAVHTGQLLDYLRTVKTIRPKIWD